MTSSPPNRFGRRPGRGIRPLLLLPKVVAVCIYVGALAGASVLWFTFHFSSLEPADPHRLLFLKQVSLLIRFVAVPALLAAVCFGVALLLQHPRQFLRMRWLRVKLISILIFIPSAHLFLSSRMALLRDAFSRGVAHDSAARQFGLGLLAAVTVSIWIVVLGRLKPRLGQNWARSYADVGPPPSDGSFSEHAP